MSYCVNCGVELDASARECALCNTPVINPKELERFKKAPHPFPEEKEQVETVKRRDWGILLSVFVVATSIICGLLNWLVFQGTPWSLAVIGMCGILWVIMIPTVIYTKQPIYLSVLFDGMAVAVYLYMLTYLTAGKEWFWGLGLPIVMLVTAVIEIVTFCTRKLPKSFLTMALYVFSAIAVICIGLEILIDLYISGKIALLWSAVVLTVCGILDITVITMLSLRRLRNAVRRRLHF